MNISNDKHTKDTSKQFYSNIDKLTLLINNTIDDIQNENAERYIKYFFQVMIDYLKKQSLNSAEATPMQFKNASQIILPTSIQLNDQKYFQDRTLIPTYYDIFLEKTITLLSKRIDRAQSNIFHFITSLLKDSIRELLKDKKTKKSAQRLVNYFKFITNLIIGRLDEIGFYEKSWYENETYEWFIELYSSSVNEPEDIAIFERELLEVVRIYVDTDNSGIYRTFLERLSSSLFNYVFYEDELKKEFRPNDARLRNDYDLLMWKVKQRVRNLSPVFNLKKTLDEELTIIDNFFRDNNYEEDKIKTFRDKFYYVLLNDYKEEYIKVILIKSVAYALFKRKPIYFTNFLTYRNPTDADAIWSNKSYSITSVNELLHLIANVDQFNQDLFFWIGYHGFKVYFNTIFAYFLLVGFKSGEIINQINLIEDFDFALSVELGIVSIGEKYNPKLLSEYFVDSQEKYSQILKIVLDAATQKRKSLDAQNTIEASIDLEIVSSFKKDFINSFYKHASLRMMLGHFQLIDKKMGSESGSLYGMNELFPKKMFIKQSDTSYFNIADSIAGRLAENENFNLFQTIGGNCLKKEFSKKEFEQFLSSNKNNFDVIISSEAFNFRFDFETLSFVEGWSLKDDLNSIPDFQGILDNHYKVFYSRSELGGYLLLNSKRLGKLEQKFPILSDSSFEKLDIFFFSLIDFKNNDHEKDKLLNIGDFAEDTLMVSIWFRLFESYEFIFNEDFNGLRIEKIQ